MVLVHTVQALARRNSFQDACCSAHMTRLNQDKTTSIYLRLEKHTVQLAVAVSYDKQEPCRKARKWEPRLTKVAARQRDIYFAPRNRDYGSGSIREEREIMKDPQSLL